MYEEYLELTERASEDLETLVKNLKGEGSLRDLVSNAIEFALSIAVMITRIEDSDFILVCHYDQGGDIIVERPLPRGKVPRPEWATATLPYRYCAPCVVKKGGVVYVDSEVADLCDQVECFQCGSLSFGYEHTGNPTDDDFDGPIS